MKEIIEYSSAITRVNDVTGSIIASLYDLNLRLKQLDETISVTCRDLSGLNITATLTAENLWYDPVNTALHGESVQKNQPKTHSDEVQSFMKTASSIGKIADSGLKLYDVFEDLPPVLGKVKDGVGAFNSLFDAFAGMEDLAAATEVTEGIAAAAGIMAGAEGVAAGAASFGPPGWIMGAGALIAGGAIAISLSSEEPASDSPGNFIDEGIKNKNPYLFNIQHANESINELVRKVEAPEEKNAAEIAEEINQIKNNLLKKGGVITFDSDRAESNDIVYIQGLLAALNENNRSESRPIKKLSFEAQTDHDAFISKFDMFKQFPLDVMPDHPGEGGQYYGTDIFGIASYAPYTPAMSQKQYRRSLKPETSPTEIPVQLFRDSALRNLILSYKTNGLQYVQDAYNDQLKMYGNVPEFKDNAKKVWGWFQKAKLEIDDGRNLRRNAKETTPGSSVKNRHNEQTYYPQGNGQVVNINLNKPLIENFVINTKESLRDFKHKVEEVLLEILNSANAIQ